MNDQETNDQRTRQALLSVLDLLKQQALYIDRQHRWIVALASALEAEPALAERLQQHPLYDLGPAPSLRSGVEMSQIIDGIIQQVKG